MLLVQISVIVAIFSNGFQFSSLLESIQLWRLMWGRFPCQ